MEISNLQQQAMAGMYTAALPVDRQKGSRAPAEPEASCPRCNSANTKFCYYNNYSLSQPRHFCKACQRFWTRGGSLRNIPVGGGRGRKARRPPLSSSSSSMKTPRKEHRFPAAEFIAAAFPAPSLHWLSGRAAPMSVPPPPPFQVVDRVAAAAVMRDCSSYRTVEGDGDLFMGVGDSNMMEEGRDHYWNGLLF